MSTSEWPELTSETREIWDQNAAFWDEYMREGNHFHYQLIRPTGEIAVRHSVKISTYITPTTYRGIGIKGQPVPTRYFHRPLSQLFQSCFDAGFVIDGIEEPVFESKPNEKRSLSWTNFGEIPPILVARTRRMN